MIPVVSFPYVNNERKDTLKEHESIGSLSNNERKDILREHERIGSHVKNGCKGDYVET